MPTLLKNVWSLWIIFTNLFTVWTYIKTAGTDECIIFRIICFFNPIRKINRPWLIETKIPLIYDNIAVTIHLLTSRWVLFFVSQSPSSWNHIFTRENIIVVAAYILSEPLGSQSNHFHECIKCCALLRLGKSINRIWRRISTNLITFDPTKIVAHFPIIMSRRWCFKRRRT